jgi:multiple sugar transport system ATP-binding protein
MATVDFVGVTKAFSGHVAVKALNLHIDDGEFMVLVGPSGCGKTTTLRILAGLEEPTEGDILIDSVKVNGVPPRSRDIAMVFQSYALYPHMTAYDNMAFGLRMRKVPGHEIAKRVEDVASLLGLRMLLQRKPRQLSGGERQRVALGRAIVRKPRAFLLDEPLSNLDAKLRVQTRIELQRLHRSLNATFIYVTHDQVEAMTMGDRIAVMNDGHLEQVDTPKELYDHPRTLFVASFIGSPSMNLIRAKVLERATVLIGSYHVRLPIPVSQNEVIVGIRPEAFKIGSSDQANLEMRVDIVETLGSDQYVYGLVDGESVVVRTDPMLRVQQGEKIGLIVPSNKVHVFDPSTGRRLN